MAKATPKNPGKPAKRAAQAAAAKRPRTKPAPALGPKRPAAKRAAPAPPAIAKPNKQELLVQVERLERGAATLRRKNKELRSAANDAATRIAELESMVARLERQTAKAAPAPKARRPARRRPMQNPEPADERDSQHDNNRDPGDAVPPGVAVEQPEPLSEADRKVLEHLNASSPADNGDEAPAQRYAGGEFSASERE